MPGHRTETVPSGDVEIFCRVFGEAGKTPLLVLHGLQYFSYDWIGVATSLAADRQVVAMDMRGMGDSTWSPAQDYRIATNARDLLGVADAMGWDRAVLIGHSMGGRHVTACAAANPERVAGLVLVDFAPDIAPEGGKGVMEVMVGLPDSFSSVDAALAHFGLADEPEIRARWENYLTPIQDGGADGLAIKRDPYFREDFRRRKETGIRPKPDVDLWDAIARLEMPCLALRGRQSKMFAPETADKMRAANNAIELVEIDAGHHIAGEQPAAFVAAVRAFLDRLESAGAAP